MILYYYSAARCPTERSELNQQHKVTATAMNVAEEEEEGYREGKSLVDTTTTTMRKLGASGGITEPPPEVQLDHTRCIMHFDIDCFYAQVRDARRRMCIRTYM